MLAHLQALYRPAAATHIVARLRAIMRQFHVGSDTRGRSSLSERSALVIAYGDQVTEPGVAPLRSLRGFLDETIGDTVSHVHVLPFFPYSSDDGFSVIDYESVDPKLGGWGDIHLLAKRFGVMADLVLNHISAHSAWFKGFLAGEPSFQDYFVTLPDGTDLSTVVRPRTSPLLTRFRAARGDRLVWTTFSEDQVDLNYANPEVLLRMVEILLGYVSHGVQMIRLDAVAFLWKELGTPSIHLEQTHRIIQLLRTVIDTVAPDVLLVTETNVPHAENASYFGNGENEAQLVYQFPLPPLILSAFQQEDATPLTDWLRSIPPPPGSCMFFNFLASHDGIGLRPVEGILSRRRVEGLVQQVIEHGGRVSYRATDGGEAVPYELNISYFDALSNPAAGESPERQVRRFLTAHAMMLSLAGLPGIYFHSLFGSRSWQEGVALTGANRTINRERLDRTKLSAELQDPDSIRRRVLDGLRRLLLARRSSSAFHPASHQRILTIDPQLFVVLRGHPGERDTVWCLHNVAGKTASACVSLAQLGLSEGDRSIDLLSGKSFSAEGAHMTIDVEPYQTLWLAKGSS